MSQTSINDTARKLPVGWSETVVAHVFDSWGGATPSTSVKEYWGKGMPWVSSKDVKLWTVDRASEEITQKALDETRLRHVPVGSVLVVIRSGVLVHTLPVAITTTPVVINQDLKAFNCSDINLNRWLALFLRASSRRILESNRKDGTTVQSIRFDELKSLTLPLPPLAEQRRIVAKVEEVLARVNAARDRLAKVPTILKRFRQSVLAAACSGRLTADWRRGLGQASLPVSQKPHDDLFDIPGGWRWCPMSELIDTVRSGSTAVPQNDATDYPILRSSSVRPREVALDDVRFVRESDSRNADLFLKDGDLLFTRLSGSVEYVANCAVVRGLGSSRVQYPDRLFRVRLRDQRLAGYVEYMFEAPFVRKRIADLAKSSAGHQRISQGGITEQWVPLPTHDELDEIVKRLDAYFSLGSKVEAKIITGTMRAEKLVQATLAKAFRGELVPTEAELAEQEGRDFETAEALLERIRQQQGATAKPPKTKPRPKVAAEPSVAGGLFGDANGDVEGINPIAQRLGALKRRWQPATATTLPVENVLVQAFKAICDQNSPDKVVADPELHRAFVRQCRMLGLHNPEFDLCFALLNLRKASGLKGLGSMRKPIMDQWRYAGASEIAARVLNWRHGLSLDRILCDLTYEEEFEQVARSITPGFSSFEYRWAALGLRKQGKKAAQKVVEQLRWSDPVSFAAVSQLPDGEGIYALHDPAGCVYVAGAEDIKASAAAQSGLAGQNLFEEDLWRPDPDRLVWKYAVAEVGAADRQGIVNTLVAGWQPVLNVLRVA